MAEPSEDTSLQRKVITNALRHASVWGHVQKALGWEGFSFVFVFGLTVGLLQLAHYIAAMSAFSVSALILVLRLVLSSRQYLSSRFWKSISQIGSVVIAAAYLIAMLYWVSWEEAKHEQQQPPGFSDWFLPFTTYLQGLPLKWIAISSVVGFLLAISLLRMFRQKAQELNKDYPDQWAHEACDYVLKILGKFVLVETCTIKSTYLSEGKLYLDFDFYGHNFSPFLVTIPLEEGDQIQGNILYKNEPLSGTAKMQNNGVKHLVPYGAYNLIIRQWVNPDEAKDIAETLKKSGNLFDFSEAKIYIRTEEFSDRALVKLELWRVMERVELENKIVELGNENSRLSEGITLWKSRASIIGEFTRTLGMFYLAYNQSERREVLSQETGNSLKGRFMEALNRCFHANSIVDAYSDNLPAFPKSFNKQRTWVDAQCFILRRLIDEQGQGLEDYIKDEPIAPTSPLHPTQQEEIVSKLLAELASLKNLLEEQQDISEAQSHDLTFEIDEQSTQVRMSGGRDGQRIEAKVKLRCFKAVERKVAVREIQASLHRQTSTGEETIVPRNSAVVIYEHPSMNQADAASGWIIDKPISDSRWYMFFIELLPDTAGNLSREHFLRVSLYEGASQDPFTVDFYVNDWQSARQSNSYITLKPR